MNIQTESRLEVMRNFLEEGKTLEIGIENHRITSDVSLDCSPDCSPDILHDLNDGKIPLNKNSFDVIVAGEVLEHLLNPFKVVKEFYRILKPNGILIISVPNVCSLVNRLRILFGLYPSGSALPYGDGCPERHIVDYNLYLLKEVLEDAGFKIEKVSSNGIITNSHLITKFCPPTFGETLILKVRKEVLNSEVKRNG